MGEHAQVVQWSSKWMVEVLTLQSSILVENLANGISIVDATSLSYGHCCIHRTELAEDTLC